MPWSGLFDLTMLNQRLDSADGMIEGWPRHSTCVRSISQVFSALTPFAQRLSRANGAALVVDGGKPKAIG